jgi:hypothetical protein
MFHTCTRLPCLRLIAKRLEEEKVLVMTDVVLQALKL